MMYNFPGVSGGIDMDNDFIIDIAKSAPNICGVKLTCGAVGKLTRITAAVNEPSFLKQYPRKVETAPFLVIDGFIHFLLSSMASGSSGAITGLANFAPVGP
jgi:4-hydroxy-2-oxoglutarate aldolase